jgi:membrane associated rhomboid family serine protease
MTPPNTSASVTPEAAVPEYDYELKLNPLTRALYFSAGADVQLLRYCPNYDRVKLQGIGGTVIATAMLAFVSGSYAIYTVFGPNSPGQDDPLSLTWFAVSILVGLVWAAVIYNLDRFIVAASGHGDGTDKIRWSEFFRALPRIAMACLIGFVIAKPLEIRIMKSEIDSRLEQQQADLREEYMARAAKTRDGQIEVITRAKKELAEQRDKKSQELETLRLEWNKAEDAFRQEFEGLGGTGQKGVGKAAAEKKSLLEQRKTAYEEAKPRIQPEIIELQTRIKEKDTEADKAQLKYIDAEATAKRQSEKLNGLIKRIQIAHEISPMATWFLTLMLVFIEVAPLIFKMMISLSPIDYLTENQKRLTLVRRGILMSHELDAKGELIQDVKKARYHQVELEQLQVVGKIEIDHELTAAVQQKFKTEVAADIENNPSRYIERVQSNQPAGS